MKKNYFISALMILLPMLAFALTPTELSGTWASEILKLYSENNHSLSVLLDYTFNPDGTFIDKSTMIFKESQGNTSIEYKIKTGIEGSYVIIGNDVSLTLDYNNGSFTCAKEDIDIKGDFPSERASVLVDNMLQMMNDMVIPQIKAECANDPKEVWNNVTVTSTTLTFDLEGTRITLTKK